MEVFIVSLIIFIVLLALSLSGSEKQEKQITNIDTANSAFLNRSEFAIKYKTANEYHSKAMLAMQDDNDSDARLNFELFVSQRMPINLGYRDAIYFYTQKKEYSKAIEIADIAIDVFKKEGVEDAAELMMRYPDEKSIETIYEAIRLGGEVRDESGEIIKSFNMPFIFELEKDEIKRLIREDEEKKEYLNYAVDNTARLNNEGIAFEKQGDIESAIKCYEENIELGYPATHSYNRLVILYRRAQDFKNEIRVINRAIDVFTKENIRRANVSIEEHPNFADEILAALETGETVRDEDGRFVFSQYDTMKLITRLDKAKEYQRKRENNANK